MPKFSIIIGIYNQLDTLPALFDSLKNQTFDDFEVHLCDDGSDGMAISELCQRECSRAAERGKRWVYHRQEHEGMRLAKNLNQGINAARGEYCVFVMADSFLELDYLEILNQWVEPYRGVCGIRVQIAEVGGEMEGVDIDWRVKKNIVPEFAAPVIGMPWLSLTGNGLTVPTEAFRLYGGWREEIEGYGGDDNELIARLFYKGYIFWSIPDLRLYHHWHKSQESKPGNTEKVMKLIESYER